MAGNVFSADKAALRREAESRRRTLSPEVVKAWGGEVQAHLAALRLFGAGTRVAVYDAQPFEVPLADFIARLVTLGAVPLFPRVVKGSRELCFHEVRGEAWVPGPLGLRQPSPDAPRRELAEIDVFIVPGAAFTRDGRRLGRGGGYYDATLARRRADARTIGVVFELNVVSALPTEPHDVRVDFLATERGVLDTTPRR